MYLKCLSGDCFKKGHLLFREIERSSSLEGMAGYGHQSFLAMAFDLTQTRAAWRRLGYIGLHLHLPELQKRGELRQVKWRVGVAVQWALLVVADLARVPSICCVENQR